MLYCIHRKDTGSAVKMNATLAQRIQINRQNKARTLVANFEDMTGITSDDQHVEFVKAIWSWVNVDTFAKVEIGGGIQWVESDGGFHRLSNLSCDAVFKASITALQKPLTPTKRSSNILLTLGALPFSVC